MFGTLLANFATHTWAQLLKRLMAHPLNNLNFIDMISQLFIDYTSNILQLLPYLNNKHIKNICHLCKDFVKIQIVIVALSTG